jgi:tetratricopeptide (TPR) repeat protein
MTAYLALVTILLQVPVPVAVEAGPHIQAGVEAQKQGRLREAVAEFRKVTELAPQLPAAFVTLGDALMRNGEYDAAIGPLKRSLELDATLIGAQQLLGFALLSAGYAGEAIPYLEKVGAVDALGVAQLRAGRLSEAIGNLQAALAKRPGDADLLYYLGRAAGLLSRQSFDALRAGQPDSARSHQVLGETYAVLKNLPGAENEYTKAIRLKPGTPGLHMDFGDLYASVRQWEKAETEFRAEAQLQPGDAEAAYKLGNALLQQGKVKEARAALGRADELEPGMAETLYGLGKAALLDGDIEAAEKAWLAVIAAVSAAENDSALAVQAHFGLAGLYRQRGDAAKADVEMGEFRRLQRK